MYQSLLSAFILIGCAIASSHLRTRGHDSLAHRTRGDIQLGPVNVKVFSGSRWTWYAAGLGACGKTNTKYDSIVALNIGQFGEGYPGPHCFKKIVMNYNGKTKEAIITDMCPTCPYGGLDLSESLFKFFGPLGTGVIHGEWHFKAEEEEEEDGPRDFWTDDHHTTSHRQTRSLGHTPSIDNTKDLGPWSTCFQQRSTSKSPQACSSLPTASIPTPAVSIRSQPDTLASKPTATPPQPDMIKALNKAFIGMALFAAGVN